MAKNQAKSKQHPWTERLLFENYSLFSSMLFWDYKINYSENKAETKIRSHRYDINRPRPRNGHKYTEYKVCFNMMTVTCIK